jgi:hypothetical protein
MIQKLAIMFHEDACKLDVIADRDHPDFYDQLSSAAATLSDEQVPAFFRTVFSHFRRDPPTCALRALLQSLYKVLTISRPHAIPL